MILYVVQHALFTPSIVLGRLGKLGGDIAIAHRCNKVGDSLELCLAWHRFHHQSTCPSLPSRGDAESFSFFFVEGGFVLKNAW